MKLPLLVSVPHGGLRVPDEVVEYCALTHEEIFEDGDEGAAEIYDLGHRVGAFVATDVARAIVDLNRSVDDRRPDGVVKTHTCWGVKVYDPPPPNVVLESLIEHHYRPYHDRLSRLATADVRLGIDCHTMAAVGPPIGPLAGRERPKICLSDGDGQTLPAGWTERIAASFEEAFGFEVAVNFPFKGGFITRTHAAELPWLQLELSRAPFMASNEKRERVIQALELLCERVS